MVEIMTKDGRMPIYTQRRSADNDSSAAFFFFSSTLLLLIKNLICHAIHRVCVVYWKWKVVLLLLTRTFGIFEKLSLRNSRYFVSLECFCLLCQFGLKSIICKHSCHGWLFMCTYLCCMGIQEPLANQSSFRLSNKFIYERVLVLVLTHRTKLIIHSIQSLCSAGGAAIILFIAGESNFCIHPRELFISLPSNWSDDGLQK